MKAEDQNKAIAELCGHKHHKPSEEEVKLGSYYQYEPDYLNDLNLIHAVEKQCILVNDELTLEYFNQLSQFAGPNARSIQDSAKIFCATAAQRAEAFLRTVGKWKDQPL